MKTNKVILPGSTICILGGGQLGKMSLIAAHQLGYHTIVWTQGGDAPAVEMATYRFAAPFTDNNTFASVCHLADVITTEWENIPIWLLEKFEAAGKLVRPSSKIMAIAQSRRAEKEFAESIGANPVPWVFVKAGDSLPAAATTLDFPIIIKTDRLGYDGKGQTSIYNVLEVPDTMPVDVVIEKRIDLKGEFSILVARNSNDEITVSPAVKNTHEEGILRRSKWPNEFSDSEFETEAQNIVIKMAETLELEGILAVEFFVSTNNELFFNEMAPRPHNSFHGSIDAAYTSQFEQHIRAICGCRLGSLNFHSKFTMTNIIGNELNYWLLEDACLPVIHGKLHIHGKNEIEPKRKMGFFNKLSK